MFCHMFKSYYDGERDMMTSNYVCFHFNRYYNVNVNIRYRISKILTSKREKNSHIFLRVLSNSTAVELRNPQLGCPQVLRVAGVTEQSLITV